MKLLPFFITSALGRKNGGSRTVDDDFAAAENAINAGIATLENTINALDNDENALFQDSKFKKVGFSNVYLCVIGSFFCKNLTRII